MKELRQLIYDRSFSCSSTSLPLLRLMCYQGCKGCFNRDIFQTFLHVSVQNTQYTSLLQALEQLLDLLFLYSFCFTLESFSIVTESSHKSTIVPTNNKIGVFGQWCIIIIIESVDSICRDSADTQYMLIQTNFSKSPKQLTYKPL